MPSRSITVVLMTVIGLPVISLSYFCKRRMPIIDKYFDINLDLTSHFNKITSNRYFVNIYYPIFGPIAFNSRHLISLFINWNRLPFSSRSLEIDAARFIVGYRVKTLSCTEQVGSTFFGIINGVPDQYLLFCKISLHTKPLNIYLFHNIVVRVFALVLLYPSFVVGVPKITKLDVILKIASRFVATKLNFEWERVTIKNINKSHTNTATRW